MHRKAEMVFPYLLEALAGALIFALLYLVATQVTSGELIQKRFHTVNIAEIMSTMGASPYSITVKYPYSLESQQIALDARDLKFVIGVNSALPLYSHIQDWKRSAISSVVLKNPKELYISKDELLLISDKKKEFIQKDICPISKKVISMGEQSSFGSSAISILLKKSESNDLIISYRYGDPDAYAVACKLRNTLSGEKKYLIPATQLPSAIVIEANIVDEALLRQVSR